MLQDRWDRRRSTTKHLYKMFPPACICSCSSALKKMPLSLLRIGLFSYRSSLAKNYCLVRPFEVSLLCGFLGVCCHLPRVQSDSTALLETSFCYPTTSVFQRLLKRDTGEGTKADHRARTWFNGYVSLKPTKFTATPLSSPFASERRRGTPHYYYRVRSE